MPEHRILTTENVAFTYRIAGLGSRFLAFLIDSVMIALFVLMGAGMTAALGVFSSSPGFAQGIFWAWFFACWLLYYILLEWMWYGQTVGKSVMQLRVIQRHGTRVTLQQAGLRTIMRIVDFLPTSYALGAVFAIFDPLCRRLGDLTANTIVVHAEIKSPPVRFLRKAGDSFAAQQETSWRQRLVFLSREQKQTLLDLCLRRDQLRLVDRAKLFASMAQFLTDRLQLPRGELESDERFVLQVASVLTTPPRRAAPSTPVARSPASR
jgi:uncharacterized RDD family membrane protein YckC